MKSINESINHVMNVLSGEQKKLAKEKVFMEEASERFRVNLEAFQKYYPNLADAILNYDSKSVELHVTSSGHGNIFEPKAGVPIYGDNPVEQSKSQVNEQVSSPTITQIDFSSYASISSKDERVHGRYLKRLGAAYVENGSYQSLSVLPKRFPTAVIFGVGLGYHLPELLDRTQFDYIFLVEPDFRNFYCSLFCIDWSKLIESVDKHHGCFFFQIGASYKDFMDDLWNISKDIGAYSLTKCFCYQHLPTPDTNNLISQFKERLFEIHGGYGFYNDATTALAHTKSNLERGMNLVNINAEQQAPFKDYPVYVIGNGPSLDESIEFVKETQENALIVSAGTSLQTLLKNDVKPDFHVLIERPKNTYDVLMETLPSGACKDINLLTMNLIYPEVCDLYSWVGMGGKGVDAAGDLLNYVRLSEQGIGVRFPIYCNPLVSNTALSFVLTLGFKQVYLFGVDNGYQEGGLHHAKDSVYYNGKLKDFVPPEAKHKLEGNFGGHVHATNFLAMSSHQMGRLLSVNRYQDVECYNVGDGARIKNAAPIKRSLLLPSFYKSIEKSTLIEKIKFQQFTSFKFDGLEKYMRFDDFERICNDMLAIAEEDVKTRSQGLDSIRRQARYLYSYRGTKLSHLFYVIDGEMLYFFCPLISSLYMYEEESKAVDAFNNILLVWTDFLREIKKDFRKHWTQWCDMTWEGLKK